MPGLRARGSIAFERVPVPIVIRFVEQTVLVTHPSSIRGDGQQPSPPRVPATKAAQCASSDFGGVKAPEVVLRGRADRDGFPPSDLAALGHLPHCVREEKESLPRSFGGDGPRNEVQRGPPRTATSTPTSAFQLILVVRDTYDVLLPGVSPVLTDPAHS